MSNTSDADETSVTVCADLKKAIGVDRMFKDTTSDAQYIVTELDLAVDKKITTETILRPKDKVEAKCTC